jgi:hypothetical protein
VYGDDIVVHSADAENAMHILESFGFVVNRDKSFVKGFFKESCGVDAFHGVDVTPVRFRTLWSHHPVPNVYTSYIAYANALYEQGYYSCSELIAAWIYSFNKSTPTKDMGLSAPSLYVHPSKEVKLRSRTNHALQKREWLVTDVTSPTRIHEISGWEMLLRFFTESGSPALTWSDTPPSQDVGACDRRHADASSFDPLKLREPFQVRHYTERDTSHLVKRWRSKW